MEQYISKAAVKAEIEKFMYEANQEADIASTGECFDEKVADAKYQLCKQIRDSIDSLEVKEVTNEKTDWFPNKKQMESLKDMLKWNIGDFNYQKWMEVNSLYDDLTKILDYETDR